MNVIDGMTNAVKGQNVPTIATLFLGVKYHY
jgi:hypothetical protein